MRRRAVGIRRMATAVLVAAALPACALAQAERDPATVARAQAGPAGQWTLRTRHLVWGMPTPTDNRHNVVYPGEREPRPGISVLVREGFVVGHYDLFKVPAWVSMRWTREDYERMVDGRYGRDFGPDPELPRYARAGVDYDHSESDMERGHMAGHEDNEA